MSILESQIFEFGNYYLDTTRRMLTDRDGNRIDLIGKGFDALVYFVQHPGVVIDRSTLLGALWPDSVVEENNLNQTVATLRRALGHDIIITVPRRGYQFAVEVRPLPEIPSIDSGRDTTFLSRISLSVVLAGVLVAAVVFVFASNTFKMSASERGIPKIAVLPCDNLSPDADDAYVALSLHQEILEQLGKLRGLLVISRSSVMRYVENRPPVSEIAELLGASAVMECSVRYSAGRIVVSAQLISSDTDSQIWSKSYDGDLADVSTVIAIQAEIATQVARALGVNYLPMEQQRLEAVPTNSLAAYAEYLRAKQSVTWGGYSLGYSTDDFHRHINNAIESDPEFALAYSDRAIGYLSRSLDALVAHQGSVSASREQASREALAQARLDANTALALDSSIGRAIAVLGAVEYISGDRVSAHAVFRRAIDSSPNDAEVLSFIVGFFLRDGRRKEALDLLAHIKRLNPVDRDVGFYFYLAGDRKTALGLLRRMLKLDPVDAYIHGLMGYCHAIEGLREEAESSLRVAEELYDLEAEKPEVELSPGMLSTLAYSYARIGLTDDAQRLAERFVQTVGSDPVNPMRWAEIHLALGNVDRAYEVLAIVAESPLPIFVSLELDFVLNSYNDPTFEQPRFEELRRKLGGEAFPKVTD